MLLSHCPPLARRSLALIAALALSAHAQSALVPPPAEAPAATRDQRIERIQHEDALTRVDELRVGGETRSITVSPKNGAPAYEIVPTPGGENPADARNGSAGKSRWQLLNF
jgi:starvation-inducible outer membrane lipoprotein